MSIATAIGCAGASDERRDPRGGAGGPASLPAQAPVLKNRGWGLVVGLNRRRGAGVGAQHGEDTESREADKSECLRQQSGIVSLDEVIEFLRRFQRRAPFGFFNGNTFADFGSSIVNLIFAGLPVNWRRELRSTGAHRGAGVLDRRGIFAILENIGAATSLQAGHTVKTQGDAWQRKILQILEAGKAMWQADGTEAEFSACSKS